MIYKKIDISRLEIISIESAKEFIDHRILKKAPLTQRAFDRATKAALEASRRLGVTADQVIEATIDRGWQRINAEWLWSHFHENTSTRQSSIRADLSDTSWAQKH